MFSIKDICSGMQDQIETLIIIMQEKLPVVRDVNLNQHYLRHYNKRNNKQTTEKPNKNKQRNNHSNNNNNNKVKQNKILKN